MQDVIYVCPDANIVTSKITKYSSEHLQMKKFSGISFTSKDQIIYRISLCFVSICIRDWSWDGISTSSNASQGKHPWHNTSCVNTVHRTSNPLVLDSVSSGLKKCFHHPVSSVRLPGFYVCNALVQLFIWQAAIECFDWKIELIHASEYCASWHSQNFSNGWDGQVQFQKAVKMMGGKSHS